LLGEIAWSPQEDSRTYVCGGSGFVEAAAAGLVENGHPPSRIRTERSGPAGA
jgi:ferredoxin-NADP reductase